MRIAIFAESFLPKFDGVTNTICHLLDHLAKRHHHSLMFAPEGGPARYAETEIVGLSGFTFPLYPELKLVPPVGNVEQALDAFQPDLVLLINPCSLGWVGLRHAKALDVPLVASYHTDIPGYAERYGLSLLRDPLWAYLRWLHNQADLNLCPSHFTRAELEAHGFERVRVWPHGVDRERFHPRHGSAAWRARLSDGHPQAPLLLYVGRVAPEKRIDWLRPVLDVLPEARLAIVGDGPARAEIEALFAGTNTVFTGHLSGLDLSQAYASADVFCFPSANETFGNVVLEAMASGLPVIVPRSGGPVDHVIDGHNGFLVDPNNPQAFVAAVRQLSLDRSYVRHLGQQARAYAETQGWDAVLDAMLDQMAALVRGADQPFATLVRPAWPGAREQPRQRRHRHLSF